MRRRLYYVMPDLPSARRMMDDLLLARIEERHIHFFAKRGTSMDGLHEANVLQKSDIVHGAQLGTAMGAVIGCIAGALLIWLPPTEGIPQVLAVLVATLAGAVFGAWASSMAAASIPNSAAKALRHRDRPRKDPADGRRAGAPRRRNPHFAEPRSSRSCRRGRGPNIPAFP